MYAHTSRLAAVWGDLADLLEVLQVPQAHRAIGGGRREQEIRRVHRQAGDGARVLHKLVD